MKTRFSPFIGIFIVSILFSHPGWAQNQDVIRNGDFSEVLYYWGFNPAFGDALPYDPDEQAVILTDWLPDGSYFDGSMVVFQPLNVSLTPGEALTVSIDAKRSYDWVPEGETVVVSLEYIDQSGDFWLTGKQRASRSSNGPTVLWKSGWPIPPPEERSS